MNELRQHQDLSIEEVANKVGKSREELRDEQIEFIKQKVFRNSPVWDIPGFLKVTE